MYYVCAGKVNYYSTTSKPLYNFGNLQGFKGKFIDYKDDMVGYKKTPQELNAVQPYPGSITDGDGRLWIKQDGELNFRSNIQFNYVGRQGPFNRVGSHGDTFTPRTKVKLNQDDDPFPGTNNFSNTWQNLVKRGLLK